MPAKPLRVTCQTQQIHEFHKPAENAASERFTIEVSAENMRVLRFLLSFTWISKGFASTDDAVGGIVSDYLKFMHSVLGDDLEPRPKNAKKGGLS